MKVCEVTFGSSKTFEKTLGRPMVTELRAL